MDNLREKIRKALDGGIGWSGPTVSTSVDVEVQQILKDIAQEHGVNPAVIIRRALDLYLTVYLHNRKGF